MEQKISKDIKKEADVFMKKFKLIEFLSDFGEVHIRGSYELDLMVDGDIDIYVVNKALTKDLAIEVLNKLIMQNNFRCLQKFYDFFTSMVTSLITKNMYFIASCII